LDVIESITQFAAAEPGIFALIIGIVGAAIISGVVNVGAMLLIWGERKVLGDFAARFGPNRVGGRWGILQLGADAIKLFTKEDIIPFGADKGVYVWAPIVASMATMLVAAAIPFGALHIDGKNYPLVVANMDISALYVEATLSIMAIGVFMAGYSSNNKYSMLGAFRGMARMIAYEVPMGVCVIAVAIMAHSLNLVEIVEGQSLWYIFAQPLGFAIFAIALITDLGRIPFDQSEAEEDHIWLQYRVQRHPLGLALLPGVQQHGSGLNSDGPVIPGRLARTYNPPANPERYLPIDLALHEGCNHHVVLHLGQKLSVQAQDRSGN